MKRKQKILLVSVLFILVFILLVYSIAYYRFSKGSTISRLQQAVMRSDTKTAVKLIKSSDSNLKINEETIQSFLSLIHI